MDAATGITRDASRLPWEADSDLTIRQQCGLTNQRREVSATHHQAVEKANHSDGVLGCRKRAGGSQEQRDHPGGSLQRSPPPLGGLQARIPATGPQTGWLRLYDTGKVVRHLAATKHLEKDVMTDATPHPPIDPELVETVWPTIVESFLPLTLDTIPGMREMIATDPALSRGDLTRGGTIEAERRTIEVTPGGPQLPAIVLRSADRTGPLPCLYYTANGGKVIQSAGLALGDVEQEWVAELGIALVSISPRVGPEDPHPAQVEDAYAGLVWISEHANELGIDRDNIMIYGKSGGGGVAAATALMARDRGGPALTHQILIYPMIDDREVTVSSGFENPGWPRASNRVGWAAILGDARGGPDVSPYAAPARATDLRGLPPTYMEVGGSEVFRDEDIDYAARLSQAGVPTELHVWVGGFHGYEIFAPDIEIGRATLAARTSYVRRALRSVKVASPV